MSKQSAMPKIKPTGASPDLQRALDMLWGEIRRHADAYTSVKTAYAELEQQMSSTHKLRSIKEKEQEKLLHEHKVVSDRVKALERSLQQSAGLQQSYDALQTEMQALKRQSSKFDEELALRQGQIEILERSISEQGSMDISMRSALSTLMKETLDIVEFPQTDDELQGIEQAILKYIIGLRIDAKDRLEELQAYRAESKKQTKKSSVSDGNVDLLHKEIEELKAENKDLIRSLKQLEKSGKADQSSVEPSELEAEIKELQLQLDLKQSDFEMLTQRLKETEDLLDDQKEMNRELKDQIIALRDLNPEASDRKSSLESSIEKLRQERSDLQSRIEELLAIQHEKDDVIDALRSAKGDLFDEAGFTTLKKENAALKAERLELAEKFEELQQRLEKALNA
jgi:chromosome segregation ATPase